MTRRSSLPKTPGPGDQRIQADFKLTLDERALRHVFHKIRSQSDRHRIISRISQLNNLSKPRGVSFKVERGKPAVSVYALSLAALRQVILLFRDGRGSIPRLISDWINENLPGIADCRSVPHRLAERQIAYLANRISHDLGQFAGLNPDDFLVEVTDDGQSSMPLSGKAAALMAQSPSRGIAVTGEVGSGKTTFLYQLLKTWAKLSGPLADVTPVYVPATRLSFAWGANGISWESLPGMDSSMVPEIESLFKEGRLLLLIDGLNENPASTDFSNPGALHFWEGALKNHFVIATLPGHYELHLKLSVIETHGKLPQISLPPWQLAHFKTQFAKIIKAHEAAEGGVPWTTLTMRLRQFSIEKWFEKTGILRRTPLIGCAAINFAASHPDGRLPRNEYEILDHLASYHLNHQAFQSNVSRGEAMMGALMQIALSAYKEWRRSGSAKMGERWCLPMQDALAIVGQSYCFGMEANGQARAFLNNLPFAEYNPASGLLFLDQHFASFLVAKFIITSFLEKDYPRIREILAVGVRYDWVGKYHFQGVECLSEAAKKIYLRVSEELLAVYWEQYEKNALFAHELAMGQILQPLGYLGAPEAYEFLWNVFSRAHGKRFIFMSAAFALVRGGHKKAEDLFIEWLEKDSKGQDFIMRWRLFYERSNTQSRFEDFDPALIPSWEDTCDWLLQALTSHNRDMYPLRHLYVYTLALFIQKKGAGPFTPMTKENGAGSAKTLNRKKLLRQALEALEKDPLLITSQRFKTHLIALKSLSNKTILKGGDDEPKQKTKRGENGEKNLDDQKVASHA